MLYQPIPEAEANQILRKSSRMNPELEALY